MYIRFSYARYHGPHLYGQFGVDFSVNWRFIWIKIPYFGIETMKENLRGEKCTPNWPCRELVYELLRFTMFVLVCCYYVVVCLFLVSCSFLFLVYFVYGFYYLFDDHLFFFVIALFYCFWSVTILEPHLRAIQIICFSFNGQRKRVSNNRISKRA